MISKSNFVNLAECDSLDYIKLVITLDCKIGCHYCYNDSLNQTANIDKDAMLSRLDNISGRQSGPFVLEVLGGEPLSNECLNNTLEALAIAGKFENCKKIALSTGMSNYANLSKVAAMLDFVYLSIDISTSRENKKRIGSKKLASIALLMSKNEVELAISVVLYGDETYEQIDSLIQSCLLNNIPTLCFTYSTFTNHDPDVIKNYINMLYYIFQQKCILKDSIRISGGVMDNLEYLVIGKKRESNCHCGETSIAIYPDGSVIDSICFENTADLTHEKYMEMKIKRDQHLQLTDCLDCAFWDICKGGCMGAVVSNTGKYLSKDIIACQILTGCMDEINADIVDMSES